MKNIKSFIKGINIEPVASSAVDTEGDIEIFNNGLRIYLQAAVRTIVTTDQVQTLTLKTLTGNTAANLISGLGTFVLNTTGTITAPNGTDTLVGLALTQTLTNKTLTGNTAANLISGSGTLVLNTTGTMTVPDGTDTLVSEDLTQTLTNKTINSDDNIITNIVNADIKSTAAIDFSKLAALTSGNILVGSVGNVATSVAMSGDVTISNAGVTAIGLNKVANTQLAQMPTMTFKGNDAGGAADPQDLTATEATAMLNVLVGDSGSGGTKGLVPAPTAGDTAANKYLKADGTWSTITELGDVAGPNGATNNAIALYDGVTGKLIKNSDVIIDNDGNISVSTTVGNPGLSITKAMVADSSTGISSVVSGGDLVYGVDTGATGTVSGWTRTVGVNSIAYSTISSASSSILAGLYVQTINSGVMGGSSQMYGANFRLENTSTARDVKGVAIANITNTGTMTSYAGLYIAGAATGTVSGTNEAIRVVAGRTYLGGDLLLNARTADTFAYIDSSKLVVSKTATESTALLNAMVGDSGSGGTKGLVPAPGAGDAAASKFLKADGTWAAAGSTITGVSTGLEPSYWWGQDVYGIHALSGDTDITTNGNAYKFGSTDSTSASEGTPSILVETGINLGFPGGATSGTGSVEIITGEADGTAGTGYIGLYTGSKDSASASGSTGSIALQTGFGGGANSNSGGISVSTGNSTSANSGAITIQTGNSTSANSGAITIQTGTSSATRGDLNLNCEFVRVNSNKVTISPSGATTIQASDVSRALDVSAASIPTASGEKFAALLTHSSNSTQSGSSAIGISSIVERSDTATSSTALSGLFTTNISGSTTITNVIGIKSLVNPANGTVTNSYGVLVNQTVDSTGTVSNMAGINIPAPTNTGTIVDYAGLRIEGIAPGTVSGNNEAIRVVVGNSYFGGDVKLANQKSLKLYELTVNGTNSIAISAPATLASDYSLVLPTAQGAASTVLTNDGSGNLTWAAGGGGGVTTLAAIGAVPNANGATISGSTLNLQPANGSFGGVVTTLAQSFAGTKSFNNGINLIGDSGLVVSITNDASTGSAQTIPSYVRVGIALNNASLVSVAGMIAASSNEHVRVLINNTGTDITILNQNASASAVDRIITGTGSDITLKNTASLLMLYNSGALRWQVVGGSGSGTGSTTTFSVTAGENLTANDAVYISIGAGDGGRTAGRLYKLDATNSNRMEFVGFVTGTVSSGAAATVQPVGELAAFSGLTLGLPVYASVTTPGATQASAPVASGQWVIQLGIATSATTVAINAAGSATAVQISSGGIGAFINQSTKTVNYTATASDDALLCDATSGTLTVTLPAAASFAGKIYHIKKIDSSVNSVIIDGNGSETIDGALTQTISTQYQTLSLVCNSTGWSII